MKTRFLILFFVVIASIGYSAVEYEKIPTKEKATEKDLTFLLTFDQFSLNADFAKGSPISTLKDTQLMLRGTLGFDGQQGYSPIPGEALKFEAVGNASPHEGTLSLWYQGEDWAPGTRKTNDQSRGNIVLANLKFTQENRWIEFRLYQYEDTIYFDWWSSEPPHGWGTYGRVPTSLTGVRAKEWTQIVATWKGNGLAIYVNGEPRGTTVLPEKYKKTLDLAPRPEGSYIGVKSPYHGDTHQWKTSLDDVAIFSRALSPLEIRNRYLKLRKGTAAAIQDYDVLLGGVDNGDGKNSDKMDASFDFSMLPESLQTKWSQGKLECQWLLTAPDGQQKKGTWKFGPREHTRQFHAGLRPGIWKLETRIDKLNPVTAQIEQPDLSFIGNKLGEGVIPALWKKDFAWNGTSREMTLWNRVYRFAEGPMPVSIQVGGKELLLQKPTLLIQGKEPQWKAGAVKKDAISYTIECTGTFAGGRLHSQTRVEFDGTMFWSFTVHGEPELSSMEISWQLQPEFRQYLMTPYLYQKSDGILATPYPSKGSGLQHKQLWLVSEKIGGFAFAMPHDANWRYAPTDNVLFAERKEGKCRVTPIAQKCRIPEGANYRFCFVATPTRPLPERNRMLYFGAKGTPGGLFMEGCSCQGLDGVNTYGPHQTAFETYMRPIGKLTKTIYGCADSLADDSILARYFQRHWDIPGASAYKMPYRPLGQFSPPKQYNSLPTCTATCQNDYLLANQKRIYDHPYGDRVGMIYYDLCGNSYCSNELHGHRFKDAFGRDIFSFCLETKRSLVRRTVALAHAHGRLVMCHAQRDFNPILHGMADYWYPGEQYTALIQRNPYAYTDAIPDELWRSEHNRDVLGIGVVFLPVLGFITNGYAPSSETYTIGMLNMCQLHDIETCTECLANGPVYRLWSILGRYGIGEKGVKCIKYYEPGVKVTSTNPAIRVTRYEIGDRHLLFVSNKEFTPEKTVLDVSSLCPGFSSAFEEWLEKPLEITNGQIALRIPPRKFRIIVFKRIAPFPWGDSMENMWGSWRVAESAVLFDHDRQVGCANPPSIRMTNAPNGKSGAFTRAIYHVHPGHTYQVNIMAKAQKGESFTISLQPKHGMTSLNLAPPLKKFPASEEWQRLSLTFRIPEKDTWKDTDTLVFVVGVSGEGAIGWFDDFTVEEK